MNELMSMDCIVFSSFPPYPLWVATRSSVRSVQAVCNPALPVPGVEKRMTDVDDGIRGNVGIVISAVERDSGRIRLAFDDVTATSTESPQHWRATSLFTWNEYDPADIENMSLSNEDFQNIGKMMVARIHAFRSQKR